MSTVENATSLSVIKKILDKQKKFVIVLLVYVKEINSLIFACKGEVINSGGLGEILIPLDF